MLLPERQDEEENCVLKELLEDSHAWPIQLVEDVEVSQLMGALSLSADERAGEESVVFPLVVVRVLQVSCCLFKKMCRICPSIDTDATRRAPRHARPTASLSDCVSYAVK